MPRTSVTSPAPGQQAPDQPAPMRADARRNRAQILAAASEAFAQSGVGVPVDEIARRAGVGTGTLYRHFPTKEALFEAIVLQHMEALAARADSLVASDHPGAALFEFLAHLAEEGAARRNVFDALSGAGIDIKTHANTAGTKAHVEETVTRLLQRAQAAGEVRPDVTLFDLIGLVMGACSFATVPGMHGDCSPRRMVSVVCDGLRVAPSS